MRLTLNYKENMQQAKPSFSQCFAPTYKSHDHLNRKESEGVLPISANSKQIKKER